MKDPAVDPPAMKQVEAALQNFFEEAKTRADQVGHEYVGLWQALERCTAGGKRFRPRLVMLAYQQLGGHDLKNAALLGASIEILHTAFIVHDDVIDRDFYRRGVPNVAGWFRTTAENNGILTADAEHGALSAGVLAGDLALSNAYRLLRQVETDSATRRRLDDIFDDAVFASIAGEYLDLEFTGMPKMPTQEKIIQAARLKTSAYSFEAPLQAGAVLAGAEDKVVAALKDFGRYAGIAYQIVDDILGVFGDESSTGKTNWGDLREGKRTALLSFAVGCPQWSTISPMIGSGAMSASDADYVRQVLIECGARGYSASLATEYAQRAESCLEAGEFSAPLRAALLRVVDAVVNRVR